MNRMTRLIAAYASLHEGERYDYAVVDEPFDCSALVGRAVRATTATLEAPISGSGVTPYLVTVPAVELIEVGEDWETSTGAFTFDEDDLVSCIQSQDDPAVRTPVLKLGHIDPRFDGQPSFGRIENMRLSDNGQTLIGDLVGVPYWLAEIMATAYPRRSFEGSVEATTQTGNKWPLTIEALSLLGTAYPAINTLEDLQIVMGKEPPPMYPAGDIAEITASKGNRIFARRVDSPPRTSVAAAEDSNTTQEVEVRFKNRKVAAAATTSLDDVRNAFYEVLNPAQAWWWIRSVLINPLQLIVDDDEGGLWMVDVQVDDSGNITFDDPTAIKVEYVAAARSNPPVRAGQLVANTYEDATTSGGRVRAAADAVAPGQGEDAVTMLTEESLRRLGLEPGATDEQIDAAIRGIVAETPAEPVAPETPATPETPETPAEPVAPETPATPETPTEPVAPTPEALTVPEGMRLVDSGAWDEMAAGVAASNSLIKQNAERERDAILAGAVKAGKFPRARLDHYRTAWAADAEGTKTLIGQLAEGLVPVQERGTEAAASAAADANAYPDNWKPSRPHTAVAASSMVKVASD